MITLALGKSIPTSIIVVETKIEYFLLRNLFNISSFSSFSIFPCSSATLFGKISLRNLYFVTDD
jgi:hypothetical protein